jgi:coenzyme F420-dependent oxidoreductase
MTREFDIDVIASTPDHDTPGSVADLAVHAEGLGFDRFSMGEATGWNLATVLAVVADRTEEIGLSDDVFSPFGRSPAMLAQTALTLHDVSGGRFRLGLGPSSPAITERWHGQSFERPLRRLRETVDVIRAVYENGNPEYHGEIFDIDGLNYDRSVPEDPPAIDLATLGPKATELAGRFADGWVPQLFTVDALEERLEDLRRGAELGDRDPGELRTALIVRTFADEDREHARRTARSMVAFLIGAYGPYYGDSVAEQGYPGMVEEIREAWSERDTAAMAEALTDEALDDLAAAGTPEEVRGRLREYGEVEGLDAVRVGFVSGMTIEEKRNTMRAVADL